MSQLDELLAKEGDHHHSHHILRTMFEGAVVGGLVAVLGSLAAGGLEHKVKSWTEGGENHPISPAEIKSALGDEQISKLIASTGLSEEDLLKHLSAHLPGAARAANAA